MMRVALSFAILTVCSSLGIQRQLPDIPEEDVARLGQTSREMSRDSWPLADIDVGKAEQQAILARMKAEEAEKESVEELGSNISERELLAKFHHAEIEANTEFNTHDKMEGAIINMERSAGLEDRVVGRLLKQGENEKGHTDRKLANLERMFDKQYRMEEVAENAADDLYTHLSKKEFKEVERQTAKEKADAERQLKAFDKEIALARNQLKEQQKLIQGAEKETSARLLDEADDLRKGADIGFLTKVELQHLLDVNRETLNDMIDRLADVAGENDTGAFFEDRVETLRSKSAEVSAHLVETVAYKVKEFVLQQNDTTGYSDRQFLGMLARLLNDTKTEIKSLQKASDAISDRVRGFQEHNPETFSAALALALDGATRNIEFRSNLFQFDTTRLAHASMAEGCDLLSDMLAKNMQPAYASLARQKAALDNITKVVPSVAQYKEIDAGHSIAGLLENRTHNLLNMAYMEHIAYKDAATVLLTQVAPVVMQRIHCSFSGAVVHAIPSRAAAAFVAFASWLAL